MKKMKMALLAAVVSSAFVFSGCDKDDNENMNNATYTLSGNASGSQVDPPTTTNGTAAISGTYNSNTNVMSYTIIYNDLNSTPATGGFYSKVTGQSDINIGAAFSLGTSPAASSGSVTGTMTLSADEEAKLLANQWYYIIRTSTEPNGEVRGQITTTVKN